MIRTFNKYFEKSIKFIDQHTPVTGIPSEAELMNVSAYMHCVKDLTLSTFVSPKSSLRNLIISKTAIPEDIRPPKIKLERISNSEIEQDQLNQQKKKKQDIPSLFD